MEAYISTKVWLTVQVQYVNVNQMDEKNKAFEYYFSCPPSLFFHRELIDGGDGTPSRSVSYSDG
jgi:hypothetical protein